MHDGRRLPAVRPETSVGVRGIRRLPVRRFPSKLCATLDASRRLRMDGSSSHRTIRPIVIALAAFAMAGAGSAALAQTGATMIAIDKMDGRRAAGRFRIRAHRPRRPGALDGGRGRQRRRRSRDRADQHGQDRLSVSAGDLQTASAPSMSTSRSASRRWPARSIRRAVSPCASATPDNYYVVRANALEDNVRFYRVVKGRREQLAGANTKVSAERVASRSGCARRAALHGHVQRQDCSTARATAPSPAPGASRCGPRPTA